MSKKYKDITQSITQGVGAFGKGNPEVLQGFQAMSKGAIKDGVLSMKDKELIALAIGVSQRCDGCIGFHVKKLVELGVTREELVEALGVVVYMGGGPALMYVADAMHAFDEFSAGNG